MKIAQFLFILFSFLSCSNHKELNHFKLKKGDILFQDLDSSPLCDAIELVTPGYKNYNFSHLGIVSEVNNNSLNSEYIKNIKIIESIPNKVKKTRLDSFLNRSFDENRNPKVIVGRIKPRYQKSITSALAFLNSKIGVGYDDEFLLNNKLYYCSELIYESFINDSIFSLNKMTFLNPENNDTLSTWKEYYKNLKMKIPEGKPGINPGIMSLSEKIDIIHFYGTPSKKQ